MLHSLAQALQDTDFAQGISQSSLAFPWFESIHVACLTTVVGAITILDLRLLNLAWRSRSVRDVSADVVPLTWGAFVLAAIAGALLFSSKAVEYVDNLAFRLKMLLLALAGINMLIFQFTTYRSVADWDRGATPVAARISALLSLLFWAAVIISGRWIGFTVH